MALINNVLVKSKSRQEIQPKAIYKLVETKNSSNSNRVPVVFTIYNLQPLEYTLAYSVTQVLVRLGCLKRDIKLLQVY